jgi:hypothetical protein
LKEGKKEKKEVKKSERPTTTHFGKNIINFFRNGTNSR